MNRLTRASASALLAAGLALVGAAAPAGAQASTPATATTVLNGVDLDSATVLSLQADMNALRLSSVALTAFYLARIHALNPTLHAVLEVNPDALLEAVASDAHRLLHGSRGPLDGIPVLLKDNVDTADLEHTTAGSFALVGDRPSRDATLVARLRAAGAVILGKANMSEWANFRSITSSSGWSARGGQTNNPYVLDRNPCGSSSGSAVAVAADLATVAIGTETFGSLMCPGSINGDVAIKPTVGLVSRAGLIPVSAQQDTAGPLTRNATDAAAVLSVIQGVDSRDPATAPAAPYVGRNYLSALSPGALQGKRIGVWRGGGNNPDANVVLATTIARLQSLGATVVDNVDLNGVSAAFAAQPFALIFEFKHDINAYLANTPGQHPADLAGLIDFNNQHANIEMPFFQQEIFEVSQSTSGDLTDPSYVQARTTATTAARTAIDTALADNHLDALLAPTTGPAWLTTLQTGDNATDPTSGAGPAAIAGYPDVTVPAGFDHTNTLPIGINFFAGPFTEPTLISMAYAYEQATHARRAPLFLPTLPSP
jgi:amidase